MNIENNTKKGGLGFCGILTLIFIILKLIDKIDWSWWWVLSPLWLPTGIIIGIFLIIVIICIIGEFIKDYRDK